MVLLLPGLREVGILQNNSSRGVHSFSDRRPIYLLFQPPSFVFRSRNSTQSTSRLNGISDLLRAETVGVGSKGTGTRYSAVPAIQLRRKRCDKSRKLGSKQSFQRGSEIFVIAYILPRNKSAFAIHATLNQLYGLRLRRHISVGDDQQPGVIPKMIDVRAGPEPVTRRIGRQRVRLGS